MKGRREMQQAFVIAKIQNANGAAVTESMTIKRQPSGKIEHP